MGTALLVRAVYLTYLHLLRAAPQVQSLLGEDNVRLNHKLLAVSRDGVTGTYNATFSTPTGNVTYRSRVLLITAPAHVVGPLVGGDRGVVPAASRLSEVYYPPVASVTFAYPNSAFKVTATGGEVPLN